MLVAYDKDGNRLYANSGVRYRECYCKACGEALSHKIGTLKRPYFSHKPNTQCNYGKDKDNKSEWHIRMQEYFPKESLEFYFYDEIKKEPHIADVFLKESDTVIEFQHSPISEQEFVSRSAFHINNGRRLVWVFDESSTSEKRVYGRFGADDCEWELWPYSERAYKWLGHPRGFLERGANIENERAIPLYSVCVYTGTEGDVVHRIVREHCKYKYVTFSLHDIVMKDGLDVEEFFLPESHWQFQEPWRDFYIDEAKRAAESLAKQAAYLRQQQLLTINSFANSGKKRKNRF